MRRKISLMLVMVMTINLVAVFGAILPMQATATEPRVLKVLAIGNSFSVDAMRYLYQLAEDCGATSIVLGNLYIGGCDLKTHWKNASGNLPAYTYYKNTTGEFGFSSDKTMLYGIQDEQWDVITLQQASDQSANAATYNSDLTNLVNYVEANKTNANARLAWHMTWAWRGDSVPSTYNYNQLTMYNSIVNAVQTKVLTNPAFDFVIPAGTAIQNGRSSYIGDNFNYDSRHLSRPYGRYVAGMLWLKSITGWAIDDITYVPSPDITADYLVVAKEAVNAAVASPYSVTTPSHTPEPTLLPSIIVDNTDSGATFDSAWSASNSTSGFYGTNYMTDGTQTADASKWAKWTPNISQAGTYNVFMRWTAGTNRPNAAPLEIQYNGGLDTTKTVNQQQSNGNWVPIGTYSLSAGTSNYIKLLATDTGYTIADAVKFECIALDGTPVPTATPTATPIPTATPVPTPTATPVVTTTSVFDWDLTNYADVNAAAIDGWSFGNQSLVSVSSTAGLQVGSGSSGTDGYKSFSPVVIRGEEGTTCSLGANAKAILILKKVNLNGLNATPYISIQGTDSVVGTDNVVAISRKMTGSNVFSYGITGPSAQPGISGTGTTLATSGLNDYKFEIAISDEYGKYLAKPTVNVYLSSGGTGAYTIKVDTGDVLSGVSVIDRIKLLSLNAASTKAALTGCSLELAASVPPVDKLELNRVLFTADSLYEIVVENIGNNEGQYSEAVAAAFYAAIGSAQSVYNNPSASQAEVDDAVASINSAISACVTNTATPTPTPTPTANANETILLADNFEGYADVNAVATAGWTISGLSATPTPLCALATDSALPQNGQFFKNLSGTNSSRTFAPVPIKAGTAYTNPGKNARIVLEFDAYTTGSGNVNTYYRLDQGTTTQAFSIGKRASRTKFEWTTSIDSGSSKAQVSEATSRFMKFKAEIKITDANGNYLTNGPSASIWCNDQLYLAGIPVVSSSCTYVDRFYFGGGSGVSSELDNLSVKLITEETTPTQWTVTTAVDSGGTGTGTIAIPSGTSATVNNGDGKSVYITPATGSYIEYLKVNNTNVDISALPHNNNAGYYIYTIPGITANTAVNVRFTTTAP